MSKLPQQYLFSKTSQTSPALVKGLKKLKSWGKAIPGKANDVKELSSGDKVRQAERLLSESRRHDPLPTNIPDSNIPYRAAGPGRRTKKLQRLRDKTRRRTNMVQRVQDFLG